MVNFTVDLSQEGVFIDRVHRIDPTKTYNFNGPTLVSSAADKITAKCGILCPKTLLFLTEKQLHAIHFFVATCNVPPPDDPIILCACITKTSITGKSFCGKRYLNMNQNSQPHYSTIIWGYFGPKVSNESQRGLPFFFPRGH